MDDRFLFTGKIPGQGVFGFGYVDDDSLDNDPQFAKFSDSQKAAIKTKMKEMAEKIMSSGQQNISPAMMIEAEKEMQKFVANLDASGRIEDKK